MGGGSGNRKPMGIRARAHVRYGGKKNSQIHGGTRPPRLLFFNEIMSFIIKELSFHLA
jgi:hypothetical protein